MRKISIVLMALVFLIVAVLVTETSEAKTGQQFAVVDQAVVTDVVVEAVSIQNSMVVAVEFTTSTVEMFRTAPAALTRVAQIPQSGLVASIAVSKNGPSAAVKPPRGRTLKLSVAVAILTA